MVRSILNSAVLVTILSSTQAFVSFYQKLSQSRNSLVREPQTQISAELKDQRSVFGSKFLPDISEEELGELLKEFNVTNFDLNSDPELAKWAPSKEFFELYGFKNTTERYKRTIMDVKMDFYNSYTRPILPQYKTFVADFLSMTHIQTVDARYKYDSLHAFGLCTQYYTIMKGYALQDEIDVLFNKAMEAVRLDPAVVRADAKALLASVKTMENATEDVILSSGSDTELGRVFDAVRRNRFFKYTDAWGVGLGRVMELLGVEPKEENFDRWCASLRWVFSPRVQQSWDEFSGDQVKMQGIEAMQKQLLVREKRRAAERLEKRAADFDEKRKSIQELNDVIAERRSVLIEEQKALKKKYEPDAYLRILEENPNDTPVVEIKDTKEDEKETK